MTPDQFNQLLQVLSRLAERQYTLTGAADWPILAVVGGILAAIIGAMWHNLLSAIKDGRTEWRQELNAVRDEGKKDLRAAKEENEKDHDIIWDAMRACQKDCCPRRREGD